MSFQVESQAVEDRRDDFGRLDRSIGGHSRRSDRCADDAATLHAAAGEVAGKALRPVIAAAGGFTCGVRPNSARLQTSVFSSMPR